MSRRRDPKLQQRAADIGLNLDKFEERGLEEQAMQELNNMVLILKYSYASSMKYICLKYII